MRALLQIVSLTLAILLACPSHAQSTTAPDSDAQAVLDRMLTALGGRANWAAVRTLVNDSQQNRLADPTTVRAVISMDLSSAAPRFRIETRAEGLHLIRVLDGDVHWRLNRQGQIEPVPEATLAQDRAWHTSHVYRTLHRLAARDPALSVRLGTDQRLEVLQHDTRIAWFRLDAQGVPYAFGNASDDAGSVSGPWDHEQDGIRHPLWVTSADGSFRSLLKGLEVNRPLAPTLFAKPASADALRDPP